MESLFRFSQLPCFQVSDFKLDNTLKKHSVKRNRFCIREAVERGGVAAMECVAMDLKSAGLYSCRTLSFSDVVVKTWTVTSSPAWTNAYNAIARYEEKVVLSSFVLSFMLRFQLDNAYICRNTTHHTRRQWQPFVALGAGWRSRAAALLVLGHPATHLQTTTSLTEGRRYRSFNRKRIGAWKPGGAKPLGYWRVANQREAENAAPQGC